MVDLNSDVGESFGVWRLGDDVGVLESVTSANVACGFHAGDASTMRATCAAAAARGVVVGAHVGYRDLAGFGRRFVDVDPADLTDEVLYQVGALQAVARASGTSVRYVKPHGALYNALRTHEAQAGAVVSALVDLGADLPLVVLPGSVVERLAQAAGLHTVAEGFPDRAYRPDGSLVGRRTVGAVIHDPDEVAARAVRMAETGTVLAEDGSVLDLPVQTLCVHGDSPGAAATARAVRSALDAAGVVVASFR